MLERWGRVLVARRRLIAAAALLIAVLAGLWGPGVFDKLVTGGFEDPGSESARAATQITNAFGGQTPDVLAVYSNAATTVDDPSFKEPVEAAVRMLRAQPAVAGVNSYYDGAPGLVSRDRHATYLVIRLTALDDSGKRVGYDAIRSQLRLPGLTTQIGGTVAVAQSLDDQTKTDVTRGEMIAMPLVLVLLILIFGGVVAASMPVLIGILSVLGA